MNFFQKKEAKRYSKEEIKKIHRELEEEYDLQKMMVLGGEYEVKLDLNFIFEEVCPRLEAVVKDDYRLTFEKIIKLSKTIFEQKKKYLEVVKEINDERYFTRKTKEKLLKNISEKTLENTEVKKANKELKKILLPFLEKLEEVTLEVQEIFFEYYPAQKQNFRNVLFNLPGLINATIYQLKTYPLILVEEGNVKNFDGIIRGGVDETSLDERTYEYYRMKSLDGEYRRILNNERKRRENEGAGNKYSYYSFDEVLKEEATLQHLTLTGIKAKIFEDEYDREMTGYLKENYYQEIAKGKRLHMAFEEYQDKRRKELTL